MTENYILLGISLLAYLGGNITRKYFTDRTASTSSSGFVFNAVTCAAAALVILCMGGFGSLSVFTLLLALLFGAVVALQGIVTVGALKCGPMSYTTVITSFSTLITALSGVMFFGEHLGAVQIVGIALVLASFVLAVKSDGEKKSAGAKWLILCIIAFITTGGIGIMQKLHQSSDFKEELNAFLIISDLTAALICAVSAVVLKSHEDRATAEKPARDQKGMLVLLAIMLLNGICIALNGKFNLFLSGVMDSAVFFPTVNGGGLVLSTVAAIVLFKERLTLKQWIGILLGTAAVVLLCNPFA